MISMTMRIYDDDDDDDPVEDENNYDGDEDAILMLLLRQFGIPATEKLGANQALL